MRSRRLAAALTVALVAFTMGNALVGALTGAQDGPYAVPDDWQEMLRPVLIVLALLVGAAVAYPGFRHRILDGVFGWSAEATASAARTAELQRQSAGANQRADRARAAERAEEKRRNFAVFEAEERRRADRAEYEKRRGDHPGH